MTAEEASQALIKEMAKEIRLELSEMASKCPTGTRLTALVESHQHQHDMTNGKPSPAATTTSSMQGAGIDVLKGQVWGESSEAIMKMLSRAAIVILVVLMALMHAGILKTPATNKVEKIESAIEHLLKLNGNDVDGEH